jgi:sporulation protein YlmC with PRC-barrel domain
VKNHLIAAACLVMGATAWSQTPAPGGKPQDTAGKPQDAAQAQTYMLTTAGKVLGLNVRNESDKNLGEIGDLLIDPRSGEIRYAVLDVGGFIGIGEDHRVVPWSFIQIVPDEKDKDMDKYRARSTLTEDQVKSAPKIKREDKKVGVDLDKRIEAAFGKNDSWTYLGKGEPTFVFCRQLDGVELKESAGKEVGKVERVILAPANNCVAYVVVDTTKDAGDRNVALPWSRIDFAYDMKDDKLVATTPVGMDKFANAPEYDSKDMKRMGSTAWVNEISTHFGADPFWKQTRFASARKSPVKSQ